MIVAGYCARRHCTVGAHCRRRDPSRRLLKTRVPIGRELLEGGPGLISTERRAGCTGSQSQNNGGYEGRVKSWRQINLLVGKGNWWTRRPTSKVTRRQHAAKLRDGGRVERRVRPNGARLPLYELCELQSSATRTDISQEVRAAGRKLEADGVLVLAYGQLGQVVSKVLSRHDEVM